MSELIVNTISGLNSLSVTTIIANGSTGTANQVLTSNGTVSYWANSSGGASEYFEGNVTPTAIAANTNDWNPGITGIYQVRTSANTDGNINYNITGLDGGVNGQIVTIQNVGISALILKNRSADSSSENQFALPDDIRLDGEQSIQLYYDGNDTKWRPLHSIGVPYFHKIYLTKGFFSGGQFGSLATADRTTYSTETTAAVTGANLSQGRRYPAAAGNAEKGFFCGGTDSSAFAVVTADRTNYSTETTAAVTGANLPQARQALAAAGNAEKGFFSGGGGAELIAVKTIYSTETTTGASSANLTQARAFLAAAGNAEKGFFSGGAIGSTYVATADRTTYSTETTVAVTGANLTQARSFLAAAGNAEKGFFSGGNSGTFLATADRTTYSTETTAAVTGANLTQARFGLAAAGNIEKGFFSGGTTGSDIATADRTTYSTETTAAVSGANLSQARQSLAAV
jgi:hypothetical protein